MPLRSSAVEMHAEKQWRAAALCQTLVRAGSTDGLPTARRKAVQFGRTGLPAVQPKIFSPASSQRAWPPGTWSPAAASR